MNRLGVNVIVTIAQWKNYVVSTADTPDAIASDVVDPNCGWHLSQTWN